jgi:hypothetical protein
MSRRSRRRSRPAPLALFGLLALAAGAAGFLRRDSLGAAAAPLRDRVRRSNAPEHETFTCECGQTYRVSGVGRHRIYWPEGAAESDALLTPECINCERPLPTH